MNKYELLRKYDKVFAVHADSVSIHRFKGIMVVQILFTLTAGTFDKIPTHHTPIVHAENGSTTKIRLILSKVRILQRLKIL